MSIVWMRQNKHDDCTGGVMGFNMHLARIIVEGAIKATNYPQTKE